MCSYQRPEKLRYNGLKAGQMGPIRFRGSAIWGSNPGM